MTSENKKHISRPSAISEADFAEAVDSNQGWCTECIAFTHDSAEPDTHHYECPDCESRSVFGAEQALLEGLITID